MQKIQFCVASVLALVFIAGSTHAGKPKGVGTNQIFDFEAADVTLTDNATDAIMSDGQGGYQTFVDGFEAYSEYGRSEFVGGDRQFVLHLGQLVDGDPSVNPSGPINISIMWHILGGTRTFDEGEVFPEPGTTVVSSSEEPQAIVFYFTAVDGNEYGVGVSYDSGIGSVSLGGDDTDGDGRNDVRTIQVTSTAVWTLLKGTVETVVVGKGRKQTTEERLTYEPVANYTDMSLGLRFDLLGFRVRQFSYR